MYIEDTKVETTTGANGHREDGSLASMIAKNGKFSNGPAIAETPSLRTVATDAANPQALIGGPQIINCRMVDFEIDPKYKKRQYLNPANL